LQSQLSFRDSEELKRSLYAGNEFSTVVRFDGKRIEVNLGSSEDVQYVNSVAKKFAAAIWEKIKEIAATEFPERVFLTGGGSLILPVASELTNLARQSGISVQVSSKTTIF